MCGRFVTVIPAEELKAIFDLIERPIVEPRYNVAPSQRESWKSPDKEVVESCSILTTSANSLLAPIHERMPVILHPQEYNHWLDREITEPENLQQLYKAYPSDMMETWEVSTAVNSPRNDSPALILPIHH